MSALKPNLPIMAKLSDADLRSLSESDWQKAVREYATRRGWMVYSIRRSAYQTRSGKWTGMADPGFPDLMLARPSTGDLMAAELKTELGVASEAQKLWLLAFAAAGLDGELWRPRNAAAVMERLK